MGRYTGKKCRLMAMFSLTASFFLVEIIVGHVTNSMALIADSFHMLSDIAALVIAFISVKMAPKSWDKNTYGWARAEVLGALVNAVFLVALCFSISVESFKRFYEYEEIHDPEMILLVGALGLLVNLLGLCLLAGHGGGHGHSHGGGGHSHKRPAHHGTHSHLAALASTGDEHDVPKSIEDARNGHGHAHNHTEEKSVKKASGSQMNMRGVFLHVMADALGSVVVIISALIMWLTEWEYKVYVDPALSLILVCIMMRGVWPLLIESALILLQTVPTHIDIDVLKKKLLEDIDGVLAVHDFHVWQLTGDKIIASAHIRCINLSEYMKVAENIKEFFHKEGIHSTTIQPEFVDYHPASDSAGTADEDCVINCPKGPGSIPEPECDAQKCCVPTSAANSNGNLKRQTSKSAQNTPTTSRRPTSFHEGHAEGNPGFFNRSRRSGGRNQGGSGHAGHGPGGSTSSTGSGGSVSVRSASYVTSTPNSRQSAPNLSSMASTRGVAPPGVVAGPSGHTMSGSTTTQKQPINQLKTVTSPSAAIDLDFNIDTSQIVGNDLTAEIDLSDDFTENLGVAPLQDSQEDTPMFCTPQANSRIVRIISKQSNV